MCPLFLDTIVCPLIQNLRSVELEPIDRLKIVVRKLNSTPLGLYIIRWQRPKNAPLWSWLASRLAISKASFRRIVDIK